MTIIVCFSERYIVPHEGIDITVSHVRLQNILWAAKGGGREGEGGG